MQLYFLHLCSSECSQLASYALKIILTPLRGKWLHLAVPFICNVYSNMSTIIHSLAILLVRHRLYRQISLYKLFHSKLYVSIVFTYYTPCYVYVCIASCYIYVQLCTLQYYVHQQLTELYSVAAASSLILVSITYIYMYSPY